MPRDRYSDRQLEAMRRAVEALENLFHYGTLRDSLWGKMALLQSEIEGEAVERAREIAAMFVPPRVQLFNLARWNASYGWGFSDDDLNDIAAQAPAPLPPGGLKAHVLEIRLPDAPDGAPSHRRTFDALWNIVVSEQGHRACHLFGLAKDVRLTLAPGQVHVPGLTWRMMDLGANWGKSNPSCRNLCGTSPRSLPEGMERPHAGLLAAAVHFPLWLKRMDGRAVPYVWLHGYELPGFPTTAPFGMQRMVHHPCFSRDGRESAIFLYAHWDHAPFEEYALPEYV